MSDKRPHEKLWNWLDQSWLSRKLARFVDGMDYFIAMWSDIGPTIFVLLGVLLSPILILLIAPFATIGWIWHWLTTPATVPFRCLVCLKTISNTSSLTLCNDCKQQHTAVALDPEKVKEQIQERVRVYGAEVAQALKEGIAEQEKDKK